MLHPKNYIVDETWMIFKVNAAPITTEKDGDFNIFVLMDAASCFILSSVMISVNEKEPTLLESKRILKEGKSHNNELPKELLIPNEQCADIFVSAAERLGIKIVRLPEIQLKVYTEDARKAFRENFGSSWKQ
jgi:hypothetical protein